MAIASSDEFPPLPPSSITDFRGSSLLSRDNVYVHNNFCIISLLFMSLAGRLLSSLLYWPVQQNERGAETELTLSEKYSTFLWLCDPLLLPLRPVTAGEAGCGVLLQLERQGWSEWKLFSEEEFL